MQNNSPQANAVNSFNQSSILEVYQFRVDTVPPGSTLFAGDVAVLNVSGHFCATQAKCAHKLNVCKGAVLQGPATDPGIALLEVR